MPSYFQDRVPLSPPVNPTSHPINDAWRKVHVFDPKEEQYDQPKGESQGEDELFLWTSMGQ